MMRIRFAARLFSIYAFLSAPVCFASPWGLPRDMNDKNMNVTFEVHAPWNILDGKAEQISGKVSLADNSNPGSLRADVSAQEIDYKAGLRAAGQLVATWLRNNPPTPGKFVISNTSLHCSPEKISTDNPCKGSVDGILTIWGKDYKIDIPIEMKRGTGESFVLEGAKAIKWGEYGFGDPDSTLARLKPVIELNFSIEL